MMKKYLILCGVYALTGSLWGQGSLLNNGASITVNSGATLRVEGEVRNENNGNITNNGDIYLDGNWTQAGATTSYTGMGWMWFEGAGNQSIINADPMTISQLRVDNGNRLVLNNDLTISNNLDLNNNGNVELGNNNLTLGAGATMNNYDATHYVITNGTGALSQTVGASNITFPVGNTSYNQAVLNNAGTTDVFSIRVEDQMLENGTSGSAVTSDVVNRTWMIEEAVAGGSDATITLEWNTAQELFGFNRMVAGVVHYTGGAWDQALGFGPATNTAANTYSTSASNITSFSPFAVAAQNADLPVELLFFKAKRKNEYVVNLDWSTVSETNNQGFWVERMLDGEQLFSRRQWVDGNGNTVQQHYYAMEDDNAFSGTSYYRLCQVDFDGTEHYSDIKSVSGMGQQTDVNLFPNPVDDAFSLGFSNIALEDATVTIVDPSGKTVYQKQCWIPAYQVLEISGLSVLSAGTYWVNIHTANEQTFTKKLIIKRN